MNVPAILDRDHYLVRVPHVIITRLFGGFRLSKLMDRADAGLITYLTHKGQRIATVVPADVVEMIQRAFAEDDDAVAESRRKVEQLAREQGVQPVTDPAELRGPRMDEEEFRGFMRR